MIDTFTPYTEEEVSQAKAEKIKQNGLYRFEVISAYDSYKVNPEDQADPEKARRIGLYLKVVEPIQDVKGVRGSIAETDQEFEERKSQIGHASQVTIWMNRDAKANLLSGNFKILASIAGSTDEPDEDLLKKAFVDMKDGKRQYNLGILADEAHINCSSLIKRHFIGLLENTEDKYAKLYPWYALPVAEEDQPDDAASGPLFSGEDKASLEVKEKFAKIRKDREEQVSFEPESFDDLGDVDGEPDDDLPF